MDFTSILDKISKNGVKVVVAFDEASIQKFLLWGVLAAIVAGVANALLKKAIG